MAGNLIFYNLAVLNSLLKDMYYIYLNSSLNTENIIKKIIKEFQLEGLNYVVDDTDEHYQIIEDCCYE